MQGNREKISNPGINWKEFALGLQKYRRKTVGFGRKIGRRQWEDEVYLRELSIAEAGIGCALWDAAIILSRWFYENGEEIFKDKKVLELGAGVGLPGIVCGRYAGETVLSDCIPKLVDNLKYNIEVNSNLDIEDSEEKMGVDMERRNRWKINLRENARAIMLDWHEFLENECSQDMKYNSQDIVFGSELVYTADREHIECLVKVVSKLLKPNGVFYSIQSTDRDGMPIFLDVLKIHGFDVVVKEVPDKFLGDYVTGQRQEAYLFYTATHNLHELEYPILGE